MLTASGLLAAKCHERRDPQSNLESTSLPQSTHYRPTWVTDVLHQACIPAAVVGLALPISCHIRPHLQPIQHRYAMICATFGHDDISV